MKENIFITGGLGSLGFYIVKSLLKDKDVSLMLLARRKNGKPAKTRLEEVVKRNYRGNYKNILKRITLIEGDITDRELFIDRTNWKKLRNSIDTLYHSAALCEFAVPLDKIRKINVEGTDNVFNFASDCFKSGRLKKVNHISTVAVAGDKQGEFYENQLEVNQGFNNT